MDETGNRRTPRRESRRRLLAAAMAGAGLGAVGAVGATRAADDWPSRPVRIVVPYAPGGIGDIVARMIQPVLQDAFGQTFIVDNKAGANGSLGTEFVARSAPDGTTLLLALAAPQTLNQYIYKVHYDGLRDFAPITLVNTNPLVLLVNPRLPVHNVGELVAYAKEHPGQLNFSGAGGLTQFCGEIMKHQAGIAMTHVPYRGGAPAVQAAAAGDTDLTFANFSDALTWMKGDRLRAIAITSAKRSAQAPDLPTMAESGLPGYDVVGWSGLLAPAGTADAVVQKIYRVLAPALKSDATRQRLAQVGAEPGGDTPEQFRRLVEADMHRWADFVRRTGITVAQ